MAKKQSFGDKVIKGSTTESLKITNSLKFNEQMLAVSEKKDLNSAVKEFLK